MSQVSLCVELFQQFEVYNSLHVVNAGRFVSTISGFQISCMVPCVFVQSLMRNYDVIVWLHFF